jgi:hypothetical protein
VARRLLYVAVFLEVGLLLVVLPWSGFWDRNYFAMTWPPLRDLLSNNFVRGAVTGLGLVNLYAGFADLAIVFAGRPGSPSGRSDFVDGRKTGDLSIRDQSTPP